jgi:putative peptidoglycan lipid II flippase
MARILGRSQETDAYFLALSIPVVVSSLLLVATRLGAIPALTSSKRTHPGNFSTAASEVVTLTLVAAAALAVVTTAVACVVVPLLTQGSGPPAGLTRTLTVELAPYALTGAMAGVLGAILAVEGRFAVAVLVLAFEPAVKILLVVTAGDAIGVQSLVIGNIVGSALAVVALWILVARRGITLRLLRPSEGSAARAMFRVSAPLLIGQSVLQVNPLVDRVMASGISHGSVTVLDLALRLITVPVTLLGTVLIAPLTASWSARFVELGWDGLRDSLGRVVVVAASFLPLITVVLFVLRHPLVEAMYAGGAYSSAAVSETATTMGMLVLGLPAQLLIVPLATLFIVQSDAMLPLKIALANVVLNVFLNSLLRGPLGLPGIALSTAITLTVLCGAYVAAAHRRWGDLGLRRAARPTALAVCSASIVAVAGSFAVEELAPITRAENLLVVAGVGSAAAAFHGLVLWLGGGLTFYNVLPARHVTADEPPTSG